MKKIITVWIICCITQVIAAGCNKKTDQEASQEPSPVKTETLKSLTLFNWPDYIGSQTLAGFEKETGIHVFEINFKTEEEMLGSVQTSLAAYDLVVASDDTVREMIEAKLLAPLDTAKIQNLKNIDTKYLYPQCDPKQQYTLPYLMGSTGMLINKKYIINNQDSWQVLWDNRYAGKLAMLDDPFDVVAAACKLSGYSINTSNPNELAQIKKILTAQKPLLNGYHDVMTIQKLMIEEKLWAAQIYSGEGLAAVKENVGLGYVIPREGAAIWTDFFVIPRDAQHKEAAYRLLNYLHRPDIMSSIASELWYATPNTAAAALMNPEVRKSPAVYPSQEVMARCEFMKKETEAARSVQSLWADLMAQN